MFLTSFEKSFCAKKISSLLFWVFGKSKRTRFWDILLVFIFYHLQEISQVVFLCCLFPKTPWFHTWAIIYPILLGSYFCGKEKRKRDCLRLWKPPSCTPLLLLYPSSVEVDRVIGLLPLVRGGVLVCIPSSVEVLVVVLATGLPLGCEVVVWERSLVLLEL